MIARRDEQTNQKIVFMSLLDKPGARIGVGIGAGAALGIALNLIPVFLPLGIIGGIVWSRRA